MGSFEIAHYDAVLLHGELVRLSLFLRFDRKSLREMVVPYPCDKDETRKCLTVDSTVTGIKEEE